MTIYVRRYADCSTELVLIQGGFRKKRYHLLINPQNLQLVTDTQEGINPEGVTHIVAVAPLGSTSIFYERLFSIAEMLNKPVIADNETFRRLRELGMPARQLRQLEHLDEIFPALEIEIVNYKKSLFEPQPEALKPTDETKIPTSRKISEPLHLVGISLKKTTIDPLRLLVNKTFNILLLPFRRWIKVSVPAIRKNRVEEQAEVSLNEEPIQLLIEFKSKRILIPLLDESSMWLIKSSEQFEPDIAVFTNSDLSIIHSIRFETRHVIILNKENPSEKILRIPRSANPMLTFEITLGGYGDWIELD